MSIEFKVSEIISTVPEKIYQAWLDSEQHTNMTGSPAEVSNQVNGEFSAWDGYISGVNLELDPPLRILQTWRTTEFEDTDPDSLLEITFEPDEMGTRVTIRHTQLPEHGMQYQQGWIEAYFNPMKNYFK
jgi:uncharacterized protein YndB with AHSA1/START domain